MTPMEAGSFDTTARRTDNIMTESEWLSCTDPGPMLEFLRDRASDRKLRLFAVACCRSLPYSKDDRFQHALEASEGYADGKTTKAALKRGRQGVRAARFALPANDPQVHGEWGVYWLVEVAASENAADGVGNEMQRLADQGILNLHSQVRSSICDLLRDLFGNPFRPITVEPAWRTSTVVSLAQVIYDERQFEGLPVLADALEEAGCTNPEILSHCRGSGPHVKGCWAVDS